MAHGARSPRSEPRWPASLALAAAIVLYAALPERFTVGPPWLFPALEGVLLVGLNVTAPRRRREEAMLLRLASFALTGLIAATNFVALALLLAQLIEGSKIPGSQLVFAALQMWLTNVIVFALWFWELDGGGPGERRVRGGHPDFLFPQMTATELAPSNWVPTFLDYLYVSFTNAMAFSPTDTLPLTRGAKMLMLLEAVASLLTVAFVAARAVNIFS